MTTNEAAPAGARTESTETRGVGELIRSDIESTLHTRRAKAGSSMRTVEDGAKRAAGRAWTTLQRHPYVGVAAMATLGIVAASTFGVGELALGAGLAYATFNVLKKREPASKAIAEVIEDLEHA